MRTFTISELFAGQEPPPRGLADDERALILANGKPRWGLVPYADLALMQLLAKTKTPDDAAEIARTFWETTQGQPGVPSQMEIARVARELTWGKNSRKKNT